MGVDFIDTLRSVNALLFTEVDSEQGLFNLVSEALTRLGLRGAVMLCGEEDAQVLTIREAVTHPVIRRVELLTGLRTIGHQIDARRVAVYNTVLTTGETQYVEDTHEVLLELAPDLVRPFLHLLRAALQGAPGVYAPLRSRGKVIGLLNAAGPALTRGDLPAMDVLASGISLGLDNIHLRRQTGKVVPPPAQVVPIHAVTQLSELDGHEAQVSALSVLEEQRAALNHHAIVTVTDTAGNITYANDRFCALSGYSREELLGQTHRVVNAGVHPPAFFREMWETIARGEVWQGELCNRNKDGHLYWLAATIVPMLGRDGLPREYIAFRTDITPQKDAERALRRARDAADAANQAKSTFLANMSHEIRTPMNAILGMTRLSLDLQPSGELRENLELVLDSANALLTTLNDILDFSKIEAGRLTLEERPFALSSELDRSLRAFSHLAHTAGLTLEWSLDDATACVVQGDPHRLRQIINNVVGNALKFTKAGGVKVTASREFDVVTMVVEDTGIGIPPEKLDQVFLAFEQADASTTRRYGGTGLGLSITRSIAQLMNGSVALESVEGQGTTVTIQVRLPSSNASLGDLSEASSAARPLNVLVAEDNVVNQRLVQRLLERWGHSVTLVGDGRAAVVKVLEGGFDAVLMDLNMPVLSGLDATRELRQLHLKVPIIALTANAMLGDRERCLAAGMDDYIAKPINPESLKRVLERCTALKD